MCSQRVDKYLFRQFLDDERKMCRVLRDIEAGTTHDVVRIRLSNVWDMHMNTHDQQNGWT